jgi:hypothetical protein
MLRLTGLQSPGLPLAPHGLMRQPRPSQSQSQPLVLPPAQLHHHQSLSLPPAPQPSPLLTLLMLSATPVVLAQLAVLTRHLSDIFAIWKDGCVILGEVLV